MMTSSLLESVGSIVHGFDTRSDPPAAAFRVKQVHGDVICDLDTLDAVPVSESIEADAIVTTRSGQIIGVRTADCVPLLVADQKKPLVAAIHSGWRGTVAKITLRTIQYLQKEKGSDPGNLIVAIGPCIQGSCYEVGEEVTGAKVTRYFDMVAENRKLLQEAGVLSEHIETLDYCTHCRDDLFHSYRRDGEKAGRQISWIGINAT